MSLDLGASGDLLRRSCNWCSYIVPKATSGRSGIHTRSSRPRIACRPTSCGLANKSKKTTVFGLLPSTWDKQIKYGERPVFQPQVGDVAIFAVTRLHYPVSEMSKTSVVIETGYERYTWNQWVASWFYTPNWVMKDGS